MSFDETAVVIRKNVSFFTVNVNILGFHHHECSSIGQGENMH